jgi:Holliday junction resolvase RusA-like endonuclease
MTVIGHPAPQGDLAPQPLMRRNQMGVAVPVIGKGGRPVVKLRHANDKTLKPWRTEVARAAIDAGWPGLGVAALDEALIVRLTFYFHRPQGHSGTGRNTGVVKDSSPLYPEQSGSDLDKLARSVLDALTGLVWKDDKRIVSLVVRRRFAVQERLEVAVRRPTARTVGDLRRLRDANPLLADALADELQLDLLGGVVSAQEPDQQKGGDGAASKRSAVPSPSS